MITTVRMTPTGASQPGISFNLTNEKYRLLYVTGLEPPPANISYEGYSLIPGSSYSGGSSEVRNIALALEFPPGTTVQDSIREIYGLVNTGDEFWMWFWVDGVYFARIRCYLESYEADRFSKKPTLLISAVSTDVYFQGPNVDVSYPGAFADVNYEGDQPEGIFVTVDILDNTIDRINLMDGHRDEILLSMPYDYRRGQQLTVNTRVGEKSILVRNSDGSLRERILGSSIVYEWPLLKPGANRIRVVPYTVGTTHEWTLEARTKYRGF